VHFLGQVDEQEKFRVLNMADVYVSTSQHEGFGIVYLEAMACDLPVVCYDYGGQTDFLESGENGFVVKLNDLPAFQASCRTLIDNPQRRKEMGAFNRSAVEDFYIDRCAARYEALFEDVIQRSRKPGG